MLTVSDHDELLALNRALMEARYLAENVDDATRGSAALGALHDRVVDELENAARDSGDAGELERWQRWRQFNARVLEFPKIVEYLSTSWERLPSDARREVVVNQLRPFTYTEDDVRRVTSMIDSYSG